MIWKIVLVVGILGLMLGFLVAAVSTALPILNGPHTSWDEAAIGIIIGAVILVLSFPIALFGLVLVIKTRKKA